MNTFRKLLKGNTLLSLVFLTACASAPIDPADRDTSGKYDGEWLGVVSKPNAAEVTLPGNWIMSCEWEPFEIYLVVDDGLVQLGKLEERTPISKEGEFMLKIEAGISDMQNGVMPGNGKDILVFAGNLSEGDRRGHYKNYSESLGNYGCSAKIRFEPYQE